MPLIGLRDELSIISGLSHPHFRSGIEAHSTGDFYLNGLDQSTGYTTGISADQVYAETQVEHTRFKSLVLSSTGGIGTPGRSNTLSFASSGKAIPTLYRPRHIFNRLFGEDLTPVEEKRLSLKANFSILDKALQHASHLKQKISREDASRMQDYLDSLRQLESQTLRAEQWLQVDKPQVDETLFNLDVEPDETDAEAYVNSIFDLIHMSFLTDSTRVATFMINAEKGNGNGNNFSLAVGPKKHHALSHDTGVKGGWEAWARYDQWVSARLAYLLNKLKSTDDPLGEGSLLDNTLVLFGSWLK